LQGINMELYMEPEFTDGYKATEIFILKMKTVIPFSDPVITRLGIIYNKELAEKLVECYNESRLQKVI
jgi:hypothetical protein